MPIPSCLSNPDEGSSPKWCTINLFIKSGLIRAARLAVDLTSYTQLPRNAVTQCWVNVGPPSATSDQHSPSIGSCLLGMVSPHTCELVDIALRRFLHNHGNIATEGSPKPGLCPTLISTHLWISTFADTWRWSIVVLKLGRRRRCWTIIRTTLDQGLLSFVSALSLYLTNAGTMLKPVVHWQSII